ncbi:MULTISPECIES: signal peptidase I [unclassified Undibacterium]|uniref:signal peptidase I n=1 Tax=unclassified Undibacterium TaxID=2630295 RepID=UPI002AC985C2|nr:MULTISPECIES: signal peptidase I [unclassified Undibacterium]MEB0138023.1 signal peptidase I [Undibacterium sp. CCC2.1]MEB0171239.1 signal peptidase I [Undibacterium sp. CCC1.1]MEB0175284.1 signal peptidase I [Undibacterium sp. CCC3.4]MEB0216997.1 signal peptidase I [Undibacterium sp. 5I2]WPX42459.1 signal peptidase I [Undibacterium sp. CCC3.4]
MSFQSILGNFALILFVLTIATGIIWFLDVFVLAKQRRAAADLALAEYDARIAKLTAEGIRVEENKRAEIAASILRQPLWVEYSGSFFPVIALVFFLRSFLYEPFKIPSSSMLPTLYVGDLILVNKFNYGIRLPVLNKKVIEIGNPQRGDVMVFKYPEDISVDYIKRVVGVPGDTVVYKNKRLSINGNELSYQALPDFLDEERLSYSKQYAENLTGVEHRILNDEQRPSFVSDPHNFPKRENCSYNAEGFSCVVPEKQYFMMGDNRDNSLDSRYWGFVPDENIVGKAFFIWMNLGNIKRIGGFH